MKRAIILSAALILCVGAFSQQLLAMSHANKMGKNEIKEPFPGWSKLDTNARETWDDFDLQKMEIMVKCDRPVEKNEKETFKAVGFKFTVCTGDICGGKIEVKNLSKLVALDFVKAVEAAKVLHYKK